MYLDRRNSDGGMRPLPPEESEGESQKLPGKGSNRIPAKNAKPNPRRANIEIRHLTRRLESFAENETSDREAFKLIEYTRGTILKLHLIKKDEKKQRNGRHNSPPTSKKLPPKYGLH